MISNILFDLGVVLVHIDYGATLAAAQALCPPDKRAQVERFLRLGERDPVIADYERGRMTAEELFRRFAAPTGFAGTFRQFADLWRSIFAENTPMIRFARELSRAHDIFILTNAGDLHVPYLYDRYPSLRFFKDEAASCCLGELKPARAFFVKALARFDVTPETCLFIDDRPENVAGARTCGIASVLYTTPVATIRAVRHTLAQARAARGAPALRPSLFRNPEGRLCHEA